MQLKLKRIYRGTTYTIGKLYIDNVYFCDTLEDRDRGLSDRMNVCDILKKKVNGQTAIPTGTYEVTLDVVSPRFSQREFYRQYANGGRVPRLLNIKGFSGVCMHVGNDEFDTEGCPLLGYNKVKGKVVESRETFKRFYPILQQARKRGEKIYCNIE